MNRKWIKTLDFALLGLLLASPAVSQDVTRSGEKVFTLKTSTEVVLVNVQVRDGKGNFIKDLKADDFTITEDGKIQKIVSLDVENTDVVSLANGDLQAINLLGDLNDKTATQVQQEARERAKAPTPTEYKKDTF